jgi:hypothetical protein
MKNDNEHKKHQFHRAIETQLHLLDVEELKDVMRLVTEIVCPERPAVATSHQEGNASFNVSDGGKDVKDFPF